MFSCPLAKYLEAQLLDHNSRIIFNFWRNLHTVFHSGCTNLQSHQWTWRFPLLYISPTHLLSFLNCCARGMRWYCSSDFLFPVISDVEHLFMYLLAIWMSSLEEVYSDHLYIFFLNWIFFFFWVLSSLYILDTNPLWCIWHLQIFSPLGRLSFRFVHDFLCCAEAFSLHVKYKKVLTKTCVEKLITIYFWEFYDSGMFKAVIHFELLFV